MRFIDVLRGTGIVLFIVLLAGAIAYMGDRVGHQVGRKRLTLFNIRPRYTSTIVAVATGMVIALAVTLIAIFASEQVKTAFFRLNQINAEISRAQARARELESKVTNARVVVTTDTLMSPLIGHIPHNASTDQRLSIVKQYYRQVVGNVNQTYTRLGLRPFPAPPNIDALLHPLADSPVVQAANAQSALALITVSDQNLYVRDPIHFQIIPFRDYLIFSAHAAIASESIPASGNVNIQVALAELESAVSTVAVNHGMPRFFFGNVLVEQTYPDLAQMQQSVSSGRGNFALTAFAATDVFTGTGGIPVVVFLQRRAG